MRDIQKEARIKADAEIRANLKAKMLAAGPDHFVEVTAPELSYTLRNDIAALIEEVEAERAARDLGAALQRHPEEGLSRMAGFLSEPDHAAHLKAQDKMLVAGSFEDAVKPLMKWLAENHNLHVVAIVGSTGAELVEGIKSFNTVEFIKD